jgi:hypothetical protein
MARVRAWSYIHTTTHCTYSKFLVAFVCILTSTVPVRVRRNTENDVVLNVYCAENLA